MTASPSANPTVGQPNHASSQARSDDIDVGDPRKAIVRKLVNGKTTLGSVAALALGYFIWWSQQPQPVSAAVTGQLAALQASVDSLKLTVDGIKADVGDIKRTKGDLEAALTSFRLAMQALEYRVGSTERDVTRLQSKRD